LTAFEPAQGQDCSKLSIFIVHGSFGWNANGKFSSGNLKIVKIDWFLFCYTRSHPGPLGYTSSFEGKIIVLFFGVSFDSIGKFIT